MGSSGSATWRGNDRLMDCAATAGVKNWQSGWEIQLAHRTVYGLSVFLGLMVAAPTAQAQGQGAATFRCALPSLTGGPPQDFIMDVVPPFIRRREGSTYKIIADDGDTLVAGAFRLGARGGAACACALKRNVEIHSPDQQRGSGSGLHRQMHPMTLCRYMVRTAGVEPAQNCFRGILSPLRLPVSPRPH